MVGLVTASRVILRQWKTVVSPNLKDWTNAMVETASYKSMLHKLSADTEDGMISWDLFWTYTRTNENSA